MKLTDNILKEIFTYHPPDDEQKTKYEAIRATALNFAVVLDNNVPDCADKSAAIRLLRECVMTANAAIALRGLI